VLSTQAIVRRAPGAIDVTVAGALILHDPHSDGYTRLNATAAELWDRLEDPITVAELTSGLARRHRIDEQRAARDTVAALEQLIDRGLACQVSLGSP
jgi:hypothetical protein